MEQPPLSSPIRCWIWQNPTQLRTMPGQSLPRYWFYSQRPSSKSPASSRTRSQRVVAHWGYLVRCIPWPYQTSNKHSSHPGSSDHAVTTPCYAYQQVKPWRAPAVVVVGALIFQTCHKVLPTGSLTLTMPKHSLMSSSWFRPLEDQTLTVLNWTNGPVQGSLWSVDRSNSSVLGSPKSLKELDWTEPYHPYDALMFCGFCEFQINVQIECRSVMYNHTDVVFLSVQVECKTSYERFVL